MSELDSFLNKISKQTKFDDVKPQKTKELPSTGSPKIDGSLLFENNNGKSILDDLDITITEEEKKYFQSEPSADDEVEKMIRNVVKEELERFFKDKFLLQESGDPEVIVFKIGSSVFKGKLELLK